MIEKVQVIALTGVGGFLGSMLAKGLIDAGYKIKGFRRRTSNAIRIADISSKILWLDIEKCTISELDSFLQEVHFVIHTAGNYGRKGETISTIVEANLMFGLKILESAIRVKVPCFINTATALPNNTNQYTISKAQFSEWGKFLSNGGKITFVDCRLEHMYGPGDDDVKFIQYAIATCMNNFHDLELTSGNQKRDFIYISDVVSAYLIIVEKFKLLNKPSYYEIPVGSGKTAPVKEVVEMIHKRTNSKIRLLFGVKEFLPTDIMYSCADTDILRKYGWRPIVELNDGIEYTIKNS